MNDGPPPCGDKQENAFLYWYGTVLLERAGGAAEVSINDDHELLRRAFHAGWAWAVFLFGQPEETT